MAGRRAQRVGRQVIETLAEIVERDVADPRIGLVTFTRARATDDLQNVTVFYSCLGGPEQAAATAVGLKRASGYLRKELSRRLSLRFAPYLRFEFDEGIQSAGRIDELLAKAIR